MVAEFATLPVLLGLVVSVVMVIFSLLNNDHGDRFSSIICNQELLTNNLS